MNYTVFDVETANAQRASICALGVIRIENDKVVFEKEYLINPETEFSYFNTRIHGITAEDVSDAMTFPEIWSEIKEYFSNTILVAHNAKSMDLCALYRTLQRYSIPLIRNQYLCTYEIAKNVFSNTEVESFRLDVLSKKIGAPVFNHHDALDDTKACFELLRYFEQNYPQAILPCDYNFDASTSDCGCQINSGQEGMYSDETKEMQKLQLIIAKVIEDQSISNDELEQINEWLHSHVSLLGFYPFDKIYFAVEGILEDGVMDQDEERELLNLFDHFLNPQTDTNVTDISGKTVCLSGEFNYGSKKQVEEYLTNKGAITVGSVTAKTDVLVLGEAGSAAWKYGNYGSKYEKARQLIEKGKSILITKEKDIIL